MSRYQPVIDFQMKHRQQGCGKDIVPFEPLQQQLAKGLSIHTGAGKT